MGVFVVVCVRVFSLPSFDVPPPFNPVKKYIRHESARDTTLGMAIGEQSDTSPSPLGENYEWGSTERRPFSVSALRKVKRNFTGNRELCACSSV